MSYPAAAIPAPTPVRPRYVQETLREAFERVPALQALTNPNNDVAAPVFDLVDSLPGYSLLQFIPGTPSSYGLPPIPAVFIFRRIDPLRPPISLATF